MEIRNKIELFLQNSAHYPHLIKELETASESDLSDRFYKDLSFGTGGLRGEIGAGTNRMNIFTVEKASQGLANYLKKSFENPSVCIARDSRNFSLEFAECAASVFAANGVYVHFFKDITPTPMLSFAVPTLHASAGIVITASHNPKEYNGYKVYDSLGGQITDQMAADILKEINSSDMYKGVKQISLEKAKASRLFEYISEACEADYYAKVKALIMRADLLKENAGGLKILYTPLHGAGNIPVRRVLRELGFTSVDVVQKQELPDGNFPTCPYPNPENPDVYELAINIAKKEDKDLIFATDPDCDRIGVLVKDKSGNFKVLTGNQIGALLCDYILKTRKELDIMPVNAGIIKTIVTSDMAKRICDKAGVKIAETLTGFKYIGELISDWEKSGENSFLFGFEESFGYLAGDFVKDKDAVIAAALIAEMTLFYRTKGKTLFEAMASLYEEYGFFKEELLSVTMKGKDGTERIAKILAELRSDYSLLQTLGLSTLEDYKTLKSHDVNSGQSRDLTLPPSNVLKFIFSDESFMVFRPSGTEPKIKVYICVCAEDEKSADARLAQFKEIAEKILA